MASRKEQKEQARAQRLAKEQAASDRAARQRRLQTLGGVLAVVVIVVVVLIVISSGGGATAVKPQTPEAKAASQHVNSLLAGIPESGNTLGKASAPVAITEYGDLECSVCDVLATPTSFTNPESEQGSGWEDQLIKDYVRTGKARLVFKSLETASSENPDSSAFVQQQVAAEAAGLQGKEWYYVELMYNEQGAEATNYVTDSYLQGIAKQVPGLNFKKWMTDRNNASLKSRVTSDNNAGTAVDGGEAQTPTVVISGPVGKTATPLIGLPKSGYAAYVSAYNSVA
jgi:protein-disulfide isomerase